MDPVTLAIAFVITALGAGVQGTVGVGFAVITVPILSLINPELAPVPQVLIVLPLTIAMALRERTAIDLAGVGWIIAGRIPGIVVGVTLLAFATQRTLDLFIGVVVLGAVVVISTGFHVRRTRATTFGVGVASGTTGLVASIGGPPIALIYTSEEAAVIRSTLATIFTLGVTMTIAARFATGNVTQTDLRVSAVLLPAVIIGWGLSLTVKDRVPVETVRRAILVVSAVAAVALIGRSILG
jgi:uncharacterized protein